MSKKKTSKNKIGKVNPLLYSILYAIFKPMYKKKYNVTFDNAIAKDIKGPAIVIATHSSDKDHFLSALTLYPVRPTYVVSEHFIRFKSSARLLKLMHVITKKMFTPDFSTVKNIMRAKKENAVIVIFAEGRQSCYGHTLPLAQGTAELIKALGVDLYLWQSDGAYLTFPKWRDKGDDRIGKIHLKLKPLLSADEVKSKNVSEIQEIAERAINHDEELAMPGVEFRSETMALGAERILFKCPVCHSEDTITTEGNHIRCSCGLDATLDGYYKLHNAPFERMNDWFEWQQKSMNVESAHLSTKARLGCCGEDGFMDPSAGEGEVYMDKDTFRLTGTLHGESFEYVTKPEKIGAFPISPGDHFDVYYNNRLIYVYPMPNMNASVKWVCFLDQLMAEKRAAEKKTESV